MMSLIKELKIKWKEKQYKNYIDDHKIKVELAFDEMTSCPDLDWIDWGKDDLAFKLRERVEKHDNSKYSPEEFDAYRKNFYPIDEIEKALNKEDFEKAWEHHWKNNRHHWEARQRDTVFTQEQELDCLENVLDWMAMGYKFKDRPYQYYSKHAAEINLPNVQRQYIKKIIFEGIDKKEIQKTNE